MTAPLLLAAQTAEHVGGTLTPITAASSPPTVAEREHVAQLLHDTVAPHLVFAVDHRDNETIAKLLCPLTRDQLLALVVVLAEQVPLPLSRPDDGIFDEVAVERAAGGDPVPLTEKERGAACRLMAVRGFAVGRIARTLHMGVPAVKAAIALDNTPEEAGDGEEPAVSLEVLRTHYEARRSA